MSRTELASRLSADLPFTRAETHCMVAAVVHRVGHAITSNQFMPIAGLGMFITRDRPARQGRNPRTGDAPSRPRWRLGSKTGKSLRDPVNKPWE